MGIEIFGFWMILGGAALAVIAHFWLLVVAFRTRILWGVVVLLLSPPAALVFMVIHFKRALIPLALFLLAGVVVAVPYAVNAFVQHSEVSLGPYEKIVEGERHLTLTGWDRHGYYVLEAKPDTVVLQMANGDVDNKDLEFIQNMKLLRELDLSDTQVDDAGLAMLAKLPKLETLRLRNTKVTDEGFTKYLSGKESLLELDLQGTQVASKTVRAWKAAKEGRKALR
jgi:hypothetical protein